MNQCNKFHPRCGWLLTGESPLHRLKKFSVRTTLRKTVNMPTFVPLWEENRSVTGTCVDHHIHDKRMTGTSGGDLLLRMTFTGRRCTREGLITKNDVGAQSSVGTCGACERACTHPGLTWFCMVCSRVFTRSRGWKSSVEQVPLREPHMKALRAG